MPTVGKQRGRGANRPRQQRSLNTEGNENQTEAMDVVREALPKIMRLVVAEAEKGDKRAMAMVIGVAEDELDRGKTSAATEMMREIAIIRAAGDPILAKVWKQTIGPHAKIIFPKVV